MGQLSPLAGVAGHLPVKVAYASVPKDGGTFTCYRNLRPGLLRRGIDMRCVSVGREQALLWEPAYADSGCELIAPGVINARKQAMLFAQWCEREGIDIVLGVNSPAILSSLPHLPESIRVVARCANAFDHGYRITLSGRGRLAAIIALTPRLRADLLSHYDADPTLMHLIPNGVDEQFLARPGERRDSAGGPIQLGFVGRLEHSQKGVLHLPAVLAQLDQRKVDYHLRIVGKGKHEPELRSAVAAQIEQGRVELCGSLAPPQVAQMLKSADLLLFPSHFEGCPNVLLEAMAGGCVPLCWEMAGITDYIVAHGDTGYILREGDCAAMADAAALLAHDRPRLAQMSRNATADAVHRFSIDAASESYAALFRKIMNEPAPAWQPRPWSAFKPDPNFSWGWRRYIPEQFKAPLRHWVNKR